MNEAQYTFTRQQLVDAFSKWALDYLDGKTITHLEADAMPINERAEANAEAFLFYLNA